MKARTLVTLTAVVVLAATVHAGAQNGFGNGDQPQDKGSTGWTGGSQEPDKTTGGPLRELILTKTLLPQRRSMRKASI